jgi:hypothetical protein
MGLPSVGGFRRDETDAGGKPLSQLGFACKPAAKAANAAAAARRRARDMHTYSWGRVSNRGYARSPGME